MNYLIVIDMQNDFVDGTLGTKEAVSIVPKVVGKIKNFSGKILYTKDTHEENYMDTQEGRNLPVPHCIINTKGWMLCPEVGALCVEEPINKPTFGSAKLGQLLQEINDKEKINSVTLIGLCTDICIISNAILIKAVLPEVPIIVDASCCAGVTEESHKRALESMKTCQIKIENE